MENNLTGYYRNPKVSPALDFMVRQVQEKRQFETWQEAFEFMIEGAFMQEVQMRPHERLAIWSPKVRSWRFPFAYPHQDTTGSVIKNDRLSWELDVIVTYVHQTGRPVVAITAHDTLLIRYCRAFFNWHGDRVDYPNRTFRVAPPLGKLLFRDPAKVKLWQLEERDHIDPNALIYLMENYNGDLPREWALAVDRDREQIQAIFNLAPEFQVAPDCYPPGEEPPEQPPALWHYQRGFQTAPDGPRA